jgi:hypothetical protein
LIGNFHVVFLLRMAASVGVTAMRVQPGMI